jgi:hypothetical protein
MSILDDEVVRKHLDFSEPIALFHIATLHRYDGERSPQSIMAEYIDALPSGSYVAISHFFDPETGTPTGGRTARGSSRWPPCSAVSSERWAANPERMLGLTHRYSPVWHQQQ